MARRLAARFAGLVAMLALVVGSIGCGSPAASPTPVAAGGGGAAVAAQATAAPTPTPEPKGGPHAGQRWQDMPIPDGAEVAETGNDTASVKVKMKPQEAEAWFQKVWTDDGFRLTTKGNVSKGMAYNWKKGDYIYSCIFPRPVTEDPEVTVILEREKS